jgi:hypothetical protein
MGAAVAIDRRSSTLGSSGVAALPMYMEWQRPVPESWARSLATVTPVSERITYLWLRWEPGDKWEPIHRWFIWQMRPLRFVRPEVLRELRGPHPRSTGHYCADGYCMCAMKKNGWRGGVTRLIDRAQWELFQETGHFGTRWWCIQGHSGGHRHRLDQIEAKVSRINGGPNDTPAPGDLPYADYDLRVFRKVAELDRVRMWKGVTDYVNRNHATMDAEERDEGERARAALWSWLESQVKHTVEKIGHSGAQALRDVAPRVLGKPVQHVNEEAVHEDFIKGE